MDTQKKDEEFLPKEPKDLPRPPSQDEGVAGRPKEPFELESKNINKDVQQSYPHEIKTLLSWTAPGRPFRKRTKQYFLTVLLIMLLIQIILFLFSQYALMLVVLSLVFVAFALAIVPPHDFHYRISTEGITIEDHFSLWQELYDFYFKKIEGVDVLQIRTHDLLPGVLTVPIQGLDKEHVKSILLPYLPFREVVRETFMEKSGDWLARNFPLENPKHVAS